MPADADDTVTLTLTNHEDVNSGHFWVCLDSHGRVAAMQEIFHL